MSSELPDTHLDALLRQGVPVRPAARDALLQRLATEKTRDEAEFWIDELLAEHPIAASPSLAARVLRDVQTDVQPSTRWWHGPGIAAVAMLGLSLGLFWAQTKPDPAASSPVASVTVPAAAPLDDDAVFALLDALGHEAQVLLRDPDLATLALARP